MGYGHGSGAGKEAPSAQRLQLPFATAWLRLLLSSVKTWSAIRFVVACLISQQNSQCLLSIGDYDGRKKRSDLQGGAGDVLEKRAPRWGRLFAKAIMVARNIQAANCGHWAGQRYQPRRERYGTSLDHRGTLPSQAGVETSVSSTGYLSISHTELWGPASSSRYRTLDA
jgi:hypothetical protein